MVSRESNVTGFSQSMRLRAPSIRSALIAYFYSTRLESRGMSLAAGTRVGPFEVQAPIGAGGMGMALSSATRRRQVPSLAHGLRRHRYDRVA